jgi:hypothetical protein
LEFIKKLNQRGAKQKQQFDANSCLILMIKKQGVCHIVALPFRFKKDHKAKEEEL